jgi:glycosyltransferase involved in cell wall biosynthesis
MVINEFIEHYKWQGVDHIYIIDNGSDDNMKDIILPHMVNGYVTYYYLPQQHSQTAHYNTIYNGIKDTTKWLIVCDADEYIYHKTKDNTIKSYLDGLDYSKVESILINWKMFGSNGHKTQPESIRKSFTLRKTELAGNQKAIVNTSMTESLAVHDHNHKSRNNIIMNPDELNLNHYPIMSEEYFKKVKMTRGDVASSDAHLQTIRDMKYFSEFDHTELYDDELKKLVSNE